MELFVTGVTGFVGRSLVRHLAASGIGVRGLVRKAGTAPPGTTTEVVGDITKPAALAAALRGVDAVIHCAALLPEGLTKEQATTVNYEGTMGLARAARAAGVPAFVFTSSVAAIGFRSVGVVDGTVACEPVSDYGRAKLQAERDLAQMATPSFRVVSLRPPTVYGPEDKKGNFIHFVRGVKKGFFPLPGGGKNRMAFCHDANLAAALRVVATNPDARGILHVADERPVTLREVAETVAAALGKRVFMPSIPLRPMYTAAALAERLFGLLGKEAPISPTRLDTVTADFAFDTTAIERLGWRAPVLARDGITETVHAYQAAGLV